ncbi:hypothetical protein GFA34_16335 [Salmonella enterica]|nr:hypothetical protein [Salmonella enterica]
MLGGQWQAARFVPVQRLDQRVTVTNVVRVVTGAFEDVIDVFFYGRMMRHRPGKRGDFFRFVGVQTNSWARRIPRPCKLRHNAYTSKAN